MDQKAQPTPRFYKTVTVEAVESAFGVLLDGKPIKTPAGKTLSLPKRALAEAIAREWEAQGGTFKITNLPLTRLANSAIDFVSGAEEAVRADILRYADFDLICVRAQSPEALVQTQRAAWDGVLDWARNAFGEPFHIVEGIKAPEQSNATLGAIQREIETLQSFELAALHVMVALTGSVLLCLAHVNGRLSLEETWAKAHVDEDWQIAQWGEDAEGLARRAARKKEMMSASQFYALARG
jgi:chaperone required for assembly of F1-ATPase